ncbi:MAG: precorrin-8X methylmutase [Actinomycetota bacterium]|nr:precorrin-8X methylmutase [Actinomycetota bacterium]
MTPPPVHPIETESYRILHERVDLSAWPDGPAAVVARIIHATADVSFAETCVIGATAIRRMERALSADAPMVVDAQMVAAGITRYPTACLLSEVPTAPEGSTRSAAAMARAAHRWPNGAVFVIGNAPTALVELLHLCDGGLVDPAAVVALPVGFVGAAESKAALAAHGLAGRSITNRGERGGSPAAAAVVNAVLRRMGR